MRVEVRNGNVEKALKILKKKLFDDGAIRDAMERRYYEKPSVTRRRKHKEAVNRTQKNLAKEKAKWEAARQRRN
jgi:small subunit ribosomal protein S21